MFTGKKKQGQKEEEVTAYLYTSRPQRREGLRFGLGDNTDSCWSLADHLTSYIALKWIRLQIKREKIYVLLSNV